MPIDRGNGDCDMPLSPEKQKSFDVALETATAAHQQGRFAEAVDRYRMLLESAPNDPQLHYLLGAAAIEVRRFGEAIEHLELSLRLRPSNLPATEMLGSAWLRSGEPAKSIPYFREAVRLAAGQPEATLRLANALRLSDQHAEARDAYRRFLTAHPSHRHGLMGLAMSLAALGEVSEAERAFRLCIEKNPDYLNAYTSLGALMAQAERLVEAEALLRDTLARAPTHLEARKLLASAVHRQGRFEEAEHLYREILREAPGDVQMSLQLAEGLLDAARSSEAETILRGLRKAAPERAAVVTALGRVHELRGELDDAIALHTEAIAMDPRSENAYTNRGSAKRFAGDFDGALEDYSAALAIKPTFLPAAANRGLTLLTLGRLSEAWPSYRARIKALAGAPDLTASRPWNGSPLTGKRILVWLEYGLGDEILFASLLPELIEIAAHCTIVCAPRLCTLFARSFPSAAILPMGEPITDDFDFRLPLTDAAQLLRPNVGSFPRHSGYLRPDETLVRELRRRYERPDQQRLVGISWRSASGPTGIFKSIELAQWRAILRLTGITFVSLQYGDCAMEIEQASSASGREIIYDRAIDSSGDLDPFAAQVAAMDLVISVSNTTAHTAGALGRPVWVLVPKGSGAHWYWFLNRSDSPWYPSARLYRQERCGDWKGPLSDAAEALQSWRP